MLTCCKYPSLLCFYSRAVSSTPGLFIFSSSLHPWLFLPKFQLFQASSRTFRTYSVVDFTAHLSSHIPPSSLFLSALAPPCTISSLDPPPCSLESSRLSCLQLHLFLFHLQNTFGDTSGEEVCIWLAWHRHYLAEETETNKQHHEWIIPDVWKCHSVHITFSIELTPLIQDTLGF